MTPQQRSALELLANRLLTDEELASIDPMLDSDNRRDDLIAGILSVGRTKVVSTKISSRGIAERYNNGDPIGAEIIFQKLEGYVEYAKNLENIPDNSQLKLLGSLLNRQLNFLNADGLDFGSVPLRNMLDMFASHNVITVNECTGLKNIATIPNPISQVAVSRALNIAEGRMVL